MNGSVLFEGNPILSGSLNVNTGGNIEPLEVEINENGTREITPPSGVDGYAPITIETNVPQVEPVLETLNVTQNGRYKPPSGVAGFDEVNVEVLHPLDTLSVTENGSYEPPTGVYGFSNVNVNVPIPPSPVLNTLNVSTNGTYTPPSGVDGYDEVVVNVPSSSIDFLVEKQLIIQGSPGAYKTANYSHSISVGTMCVVAVLDYNIVYITAFKWTTNQQTVDIVLNNDTLRLFAYGDRIVGQQVGGQWRDILINVAVMPSDIVDFS